MLQTILEFKLNTTSPKFQKRLVRFIIIFLVFLGITYILSPKAYQKKGKTMGTTYYIKAYVPKWQPRQKTSIKIEKELEKQTQQFSTYRIDSEITHFNTHLSTTPIYISKDFQTLMKNSQVLYTQSNGYWDPTIWPLYKLWGFSKQIYTPPSKKKLNDTLHHIGFHKITLTPDAKASKMSPKIQIDFSSIAKGFTVDKISQLLDKLGSQSYFIEIGGEIKSRGKKPNGTPWIAGIEHPNYQSQKQYILSRIQLHNQALATSGDYRRFFKNKRKRLSHIINPKTGYPIKSNIISVSVLHSSCLIADGLATALMVMPLKDGQSLINTLPQTEALWVLNTPKTPTIIKSDGFHTLPAL